MDVRKSTVSDPALWDIPEESAPQTTWRPDLMKRLTYTQFWQLIKEGQIEKVRPCCSLHPDPDWRAQLSVIQQRLTYTHSW